MKFVDSSGWVEYLLDSPRADLFAGPIEQRNQLLIPTIALFEVHKVLSRSLPADLVKRALDVMRQSRVLELTNSRAIAVSVVAGQHRLALADAAMYRMAQELGATFCPACATSPNHRPETPGSNCSSAAPAASNRRS